MATLKYSRQREAIKEFLHSRCDHPTADTVYENIREIYPNISLGTVYRNLSLLVDLGEVMKITAPQGPDRFDGKTMPHSHFICNRCHCVMDLELEEDDGLEQRAGEKFSGVIEGHVTQFYGLCGECAKKIQEVS